MMDATRIGSIALALLLLMPFTGLAAPPHVIASVRPLHALLVTLTEGVVEPELLISDQTAYARELTETQRAKLAEADILIWVGPGLERGLWTALSGTAAGQSPVAVAISRHIPLRPKSGVGVAGVPPGPMDRQRTHDLRFWRDPKLLMIAASHLVPILVGFDPDNAERYLWNEVRLRHRLGRPTRELPDAEDYFDKMAPR